LSMTTGLSTPWENAEFTPQVADAIESKNAMNLIFMLLG